MAIARGGADLNEEIGGETRRLRLRNDEIARFEAQHDLGIYVLWDQLIGAAQKPQARHVRDLVALALVGGGMIDVDADKLIDSLGPDQNPRLLVLAKAVLGVAFYPDLLRGGQDKKKAGGSPSRKPSASDPSDMTPSSG